MITLMIMIMITLMLTIMILMPVDDKVEENYKEMNKAERRAKRILKKNKYRYQKIKCCATCKKSSQGYPEEGRTCDLAYQDGWMFGEVDDLSICDLYEAIE